MSSEMMCRASIDVCNARAGLETRNLNLAGVNPLPACKKLFLNANLAC